MLRLHPWTIDLRFNDVDSAISEQIWHHIDWELCLTLLADEVLELLDQVVGSAVDGTQSTESVCFFEHKIIE